MIKGKRVACDLRGHEDCWLLGTLTGESKLVPNRKWGGKMTAYAVKLDNGEIFWSRPHYIYFDVEFFERLNNLSKQYRQMLREVYAKEKLVDLPGVKAK